MSVRDLRPAGPIETLDRAFSAVRAAGLGSLGRAWLGSVPLVMAVLGIYYFERVEGVRVLRPVLAFALVLAWWFRAVLLSREARAMVLRAWPLAPLEDGAGAPLAVVRTASIVALGLWCWLWPAVGASLAGPVGLLLVLPLYALRGAVAPSWLARSGMSAAGGVRAFASAVADNADRRGTGVGIELLLLLAMCGAWIDVYAVLAFGVSVGRNLLGLDLALTGEFLSMSNTFVLLLVTGATAVLFEPLRVALSASAYVEARVLQEGLDLRAQVEEALGATERRAPRRTELAPLSAAAVLALAIGLQGAVAHGQEVTAPLDPVGTEHVDRSSSHPVPAAQFEADAQVRAEVETILADTEFQEFEDERGKSLRELVERFLEWLFRSRPPRRETRTSAPSFALPMPPVQVFIALGLILLFAIAAYVVATRQREKREQVSPVAATLSDPRERPPAEFLDDAALLARNGDYREALRALYLATLVALDRRRLIAFDPHLTNWQYIRQMARGEERQLFSQFTRLFDHKWYGREPATEDDYRTCRALADRICAPRAAEGA